MRLPHTNPFIEPKNKKIKYCKITILILSILGYVLIGFLWFVLVENFSLLDASLLVVILFTAVGYGIKQDLQIITYAFLSGYIILGVGLLSVAILYCWNRAKKYIKSTKTRNSFFVYKKRISDDKSLFFETKISSNLIPKYDFFHLYFIIFWVGWVFGGGLLIGLSQENWPIEICIYFAVVSASTVGFGDFAPTTQISKFMCIFYLPVAVVSTIYMVSRVFLYVNSKFQDEETNNDKIDFKKFLDDMLDSNILNALCIEHDDGFTCNDLLLHVLLNQELMISDKRLNEIASIRQFFEILDVDNDGKICPKELKKNLMQQKYKTNQIEMKQVNLIIKNEKLLPSPTATTLKLVNLEQTSI